MSSETPEVPKAMQEKFAAIVALIEPFCAKHLDEHYRKLILEATAALCRKRTSPLLRGKGNIWAAAIIHAIGTANLLVDSSQKPHCKAPQIYEFFGTAASTSQNKSKEIREMLGMSMSNFKWMLPSTLQTTRSSGSFRLTGCTWISGTYRVNLVSESVCAKYFVHR